MATPPAAPVPQLREPLGLPRGSVRAGLALILSATFWYLILTGQRVRIDALLLDAVILVVAFYFGVRSSMPVSPVQSTAAAHQPFFLPRGSIRVVLLVGFLAVFAFAWFRGDPLDESLVLIIQVLASYLAGYVISVITNRRIRRGLGPNRPLAILRHVIAAAALAITGIVCWSLVFGWPPLPGFSERLLSWTIAFYFGSRLAAL